MISFLSYSKRRRSIVVGFFLLSLTGGISLAQTVTGNYLFTHFAGPSGGSGNADRKGTDARFGYPAGVAVDVAGNVYVADSDNHTIRKITADGMVSTFAGKPGVRGAIDGPGTDARFNTPYGVAVDATGNVYVTDKFNNLIRKISPAGVTTTLAGSTEMGSADGIGTAARFGQPNGVAVDSAGNVYVADSYNNTVRKITPGGSVSTLAGLAGSTGSADGTGSDARFTSLTSVAVDAAGNVYVADQRNSVVRKINPFGVVTTLAGTAGQDGSADGTGAAARFNRNHGITVDTAGNLYVADSANQTIRKITPGGTVTLYAGKTGTPGNDDGAANAATFHDPNSVAVDGTGNLYVADLFNNLIRKISPSGTVSTLAGGPIRDGAADDKGTHVVFSGDVIAEKLGNLLSNESGIIRRITPDGAMKVVLDLSALGDLRSMVEDSAGNLFFPTGTGITKISSDGTIALYAGSPNTNDYKDGPRLDARFTNVVGLTIDGADNLYATDAYSNTIRKISASGNVSTLAGAALQFSDDVNGKGDQARFSSPSWLVVDPAGNLFVTEFFSSAIRKITSDGTVTTLAGSFHEEGDVDGTGVNARFSSNMQLAVDKAGNLYAADYGNNSLRKITPDGVVTTIAGSKQILGGADGVGAAADFNGIYRVGVDASDNVYVVDQNNRSLRKGRKAGPPVITTQPHSLSADVGANVTLTVTAAGAPTPTYQWYINGLIFNNATTATLNLNTVRGTDAGDYTVRVTNELGTVTSDKATLTVNGASSPPPSSGPGSGGGAIGATWVFALIVLTGGRKFFATRKHQATAR